MRRTSLLLFLIAPLLLVLLLVQLAQPRGAHTLQADATPVATPTDADGSPVGAELDQAALENADEAGAPLAESIPLSPALSVRVRASLPFTLTLPGAPGSPAAGADAASALVQPAVETPAVETPAAETPAVETPAAETPAAETPAAETPAAAEPLTLTTSITGAEVLTDLLAPLTSTAPGLTLTVPGTTTAAITGATVTTLELPAGLLDPAPAMPGDVVSSAAAETPLLSASDAATPDAAAEAGIAPTEATTATTDIGAGLPFTLEIDMQLLLTDTMTSTVPATLVVKLSGMPTFTLPVEVLFGTIDRALVNVEPVTLTAPLTVAEVITLTTDVTATASPTATLEATPTVEATPTPLVLTPLTVTVPVTINVRPGPGTDFDAIRTVGPNSILNVVAIDSTREWLLLDDGYWIAVVVIGQAPAGLPVANAALVEQVRAEAALREPTPTPTPLPPTATPTPLPTVGPVVGTTTTNANLRAGPATTSEIVGNTILGQQVTVVARNEAGDWLRLDSGNWISTALVAGLPAVATIPVFDPNATPTPPPLVPTATPPAVDATAPATETVPPAGTPEAPLLPTATPSPAAATPAPLTVEENLYLVEFDAVARKYSLALTGIDRLVDSASGNPAVLADAQWATDMNTAIQLLRGAGNDVANATVPARMAAAHAELTAAATHYNAAADALALGLTQGSIEPFTAAFSAITSGDARLADAATAIAAFRP